MRDTNRFSDESFLRNLGIETISNVLKATVRALFHVVIRYCVFGGILGAFWVMAIISPNGWLFGYLLPAFLLAIPVVLLSDQQVLWEKIFSFILWVTLVGAAVLFLLHSFQQIGQQSAKIILVVAVGGVVAWFCAHWIFFRKKNRQDMYPHRSTVIRVVWAIGVLVLPMLFLTIFYYRVVHHQRIESSASILFCVIAFVICLTLAIMRIFWMDAIRNYRAVRVGEYPSEDVVNLLELLIPRSMFLVVMVPCLIFSEAVMFAVIYRITHLGSKSQSVPPESRMQPRNMLQKTSQSNPTSTTSRSDTTTKKVVFSSRESGNSQRVGSQTTAQPVTTGSVSQVLPKIEDPGYRLWEWVGFSIRPYVFPKNPDGKEVDAPEWIKWFGRILLSLIVLLLFTHQLNIWGQFKNRYLSLYNLSRKGAKTSETNDDIERQWYEIELDIRSLLNNYGGIWRWMILFAVTAPVQWLSWKWVLDTGTAFLETVDRTYRYCKARWDVAVLGGSFLLIAVTLPFAVIYRVHAAFWLCVSPSALVWIALLVSRLYEQYPPNIRGWILPWLYPVHLVISLIYFFVALSVRHVDHRSLQVLLIISLGTVIIYPILYWFSDGRQVEPEEIPIQFAKCHHAEQVRMAFLRQFFILDHRQWVLGALIYRIYAGRSRLMSARFMGPSIQLGFFQYLRSIANRLENFLQQTMGSLRNALRVNFGLSSTLAFVVLVSISTKSEETALVLLQQFGFTLLCVWFPLGVVWFFNAGVERWKKKTLDDLRWSLRTVTLGLVGLTLVAMSFLVVLVRPSTLLGVTMVLGFGLLWSFPWVVLFSWRHLEQNRRQAELLSEHGEQPSITRSSRLGPWIDVLRRQESNALAHIYRRVHQWGRTDQKMRDAMCLGFVALLRNMQERLQTEQWFREEVRELDRVTRMWLGEGTVVASQALTQPANELAVLFAQTLDVLGAIVYDQTHLERRKMLEHYQPPDIQVVFKALEEVLQLSRPTARSIRGFGVDVQEMEELDQIVEDLHDLLHSLLKKSLSTIPVPDVDVKWCQDYRSEILRVIHLLELTHPMESLGVFPTQEPTLSGEYVLSLVSENWGNHEKLMRLPTPLARCYETLCMAHQEVTVLQQRGWRNKDDISPLYVAPLQLRRDQRLEHQQEYHLEKVREQYLLRFRDTWWKAQRKMYQECLGYLLAGVKAHLPMEQAFQELLNLRWETPKEQIQTYKGLVTEWENLPVDARPWAELYLAVYQEEMSDILSRHEVDIKSQEKAFEALERMLVEIFCEKHHTQTNLQHGIPLQIPMDGEQKKAANFAILFSGACPRVHWLEHVEAPLPSSPLFQGASLLWTGFQSREFRRLDIWNAQWLLSLLWQACRSWEMWVPPVRLSKPVRYQKNPFGTSSQDLKYRQENLQDFKETLSALGQMLPMPAWEEQEKIDELFAKIEERIELLENNIHQSTANISLETSLYFKAPLKIVKDKLKDLAWLGDRRMAQLLFAGLLPQHTFLYLADVIFTGEDILLLYRSGDGSEIIVQAQDNSLTMIAQEESLSTSTSVPFHALPSVISNPSFSSLPRG